MGRHVFEAMGSYEGRSDVVPGATVAQAMVAGGKDVLTAPLCTVEILGWGLNLALQGEGLSLLQEICDDGRAVHRSG